jgi:hypothetical protein
MFILFFEEDIIMKLVQTILLATAVLFLSGFNLENSIVPKEDILSGGPPKDGIPALLDPQSIPNEKASYLEDSDQVIGVRVNGSARAYPIKILNWHEAVNDVLGGEPIVVTF